MIIFSLVGCEGGGDTGVPDDKSFNKGGAKTAGQAALKFFNKIREKDVKYCYFHSLPHHRWLKGEMEKRGFSNLSKKDRRQKEEEIFHNEIKGIIDPYKSLWNDWPETLDGTEITIVESDMMSETEMSKEGIVANGDVVYRVFLQFTFNKLSSSHQSKGRLVRQFILEVPVHFDEDRYFVNSSKWKSVPANMKFWDTSSP